MSVDETDPPGPDETSKAVATRATPLVKRSSDAPAGLPYREYERYLRQDFYYSCAYCSMTEFEAKGIRFVIDHYVPQVSRPDLIDAYENLMYACDECNNRKLDLYPPEAARNAGHRFFRVDHESRSEHFRTAGAKVEGTTPVGRFTVDFTDLNRDMLVRLREHRRKFMDYDAYVGEGVMALVGYPLDTLDPKIKAVAKAAIDELLKAVGQQYDSFDDALEAFAKSPLLNLVLDEVEAEKRRKERRENMRELEGIYPGKWRGRNPRRRKPKANA